MATPEERAAEAERKGKRKAALVLASAALREAAREATKGQIALAESSIEGAQNHLRVARENE